MVSRAVPQTFQYDAFWYEHQRARAMGNGSGAMDEFVYSDPIIMPEEEEEDPSLTDQSLNSHTDASIDEMMMVPTDSCSPSQ
jgi:hypothetical protein